MGLNDKILAWLAASWQRKVADVSYILGSMIGAVLVASNTGHAVFGYVLFFVSSVAGVYLLKNTNASGSLMFVTLYFGVVNVFGIFRHYFY
jgi:hypothetical protein